VTATRGREAVRVVEHAEVREDDLEVEEDTIECSRVGRDEDARVAMTLLVLDRVSLNLNSWLSPPDLDFVFSAH